jgi:hypothetical protein
MVLHEWQTLQVTLIRDAFGDAFSDVLVTF